MEKLVTGFIVHHDGERTEENFKAIHDMGFTTCQMSSAPGENHSKEEAERVLALCKKYDLTITALIAGWSGPQSWTFTDGPSTLGLVPTAFRMKRMEEIEEAIEFASYLGVHDVNTHVGFIPEDPANPQYHDVLIALREICRHARYKDIYFNLETGQETPTTILRAIMDSGCKNIGVNFDPANLLMYGKANPVDALDIIGKYIRGVHGKDGAYPTNPYELGKEYALGKGLVDFPRFIKKLWECGYRGAITIEREIPAGEEQRNDVIKGDKFLREIIDSVCL